MICKHQSLIDLCHACQYVEGRNDGLEEAAKLIEGFTILDPIGAAVAIRGLKEKP